MYHCITVNVFNGFNLNIKKIKVKNHISYTKGKIYCSHPNVKEIKEYGYLLEKQNDNECGYVISILVGDDIKFFEGTNIQKIKQDAEDFIQTL